MSKNISLASNYSREASYHEFAVKTGSLDVGNTQPYGSPTISETSKGILYPNTQSAIDDLAAMFTTGIGGVHISEDGINPAGSSQVDEFKFTGIVQDADKLAGDDINFDFYGFPTVVKVGDTGEEVAAKVKLKLEEAASANYVINTVGFGATLDILQIKYNDYQTHVLPKRSYKNITTEQTTVSPAKSGYGVWTRIGTQTLTLDGATSPVTLYYFKREA